MIYEIKEYYIVSIDKEEGTCSVIGGPFQYIEDAWDARRDMEHNWWYEIATRSFNLEV